MRVRFADVVTLSSAMLATFSLAVVVVYEDLGLAIRLLLFSYILDIVDGIVARYEGPTEEGFMLDRAVDRYNQVVVPVIILLSVIEENVVLYIIYSIILVPWAFYRLVYRRVLDRRYFYGLPLLAHSLVITMSLLTDAIPNLVVLYIILIGSILPIPYYRRPLSRSDSGPRGKASYVFYDLARMLPLAILILLPEGWLLKIITNIVIYGVLVYALIGYLPFLVERFNI